MSPARLAVHLRLLAAIHVVIGLPAMASGGLMGIWPDGSKLGLSPALLVHSPFTNFLVPGVALYWLGTLNLIAAYLAARMEPKVERVSGLVGGVLAIWIAVETLMLQTSSVLQIVYGLTGLLLIANAFYLAGSRKVQE